VKGNGLKYMLGSLLLERREGVERRLRESLSGVGTWLLVLGSYGASFSGAEFEVVPTKGGFGQSPLPGRANLPFTYHLSLPLFASLREFRSVLRA
jgi:hypothetical protein